MNNLQTKALEIAKEEILQSTVVWVCSLGERRTVYLDAIVRSYPFGYPSYPSMFSNIKVVDILYLYPVFALVSGQYPGEIQSVEKNLYGPAQEQGA